MDDPTPPTSQCWEADCTIRYDGSTVENNDGDASINNGRNKATKDIMVYAKPTGKEGCFQKLQPQPARHTFLEEQAQGREVDHRERNPET